MISTYRTKFANEQRTNFKTSCRCKEIILSYIYGGQRFVLFFPFDKKSQRSPRSAKVIVSGAFTIVTSVADPRVCVFLWGRGTIQHRSPDRRVTFTDRVRAVKYQAYTSHVTGYHQLARNEGEKLVVVRTLLS